MTSKKRSKVAIVGFASSTRDLAPYKDSSWDIWGINEMGMIYENGRFDQWFNLHKNVEILPGNRAWLAKKLNTPVWLLEPCSDVPHAKVFPFDAMCAHPKVAPAIELMRCKGYHGKYFSSSIAILIPWAITQGYEEIALYGVDMSHDSEYAYQTKCVEFWLGYVAGLGIRFYVPPDSHLLKLGWLYGYEDPPNSEGIITEQLMGERMRFLRAEKDKMDQQIADLIKASAQFQGALDDAAFVKNHITTIKRQMGLPPGPS